MDTCDSSPRHSVLTPMKSLSNSPTITCSAPRHVPRQNNIISCLLRDQSVAMKPAVSYRELYMNNILSSISEMHSMDVVGHHGCVNSIDYSKLGEEFMVTGGDDKRVLVWRVADLITGNGLNPISMTTSHMSNIFTVGFSCDNAFIFTGGDDAAVIQHDFKTGQSVNTFSHLDSVYCLDVHPSSPSVLMTASEDGCVYIVDSRQPTNNLTRDMVLCESTRCYQCVAINPMEPCLVAVSSSHSGTALYDTRQRKQVLSYQSSDWVLSRQNSVSVCFNRTGRQLFSLYRRSPPCLFDVHEPKPTHRFVDQTGSYRNRVTLKSGCFMGTNDGYVVSGSDDFRVYIWKIPESKPDSVGVKSVFDSFSPQVEPHLILPGHRSIVNQARYSHVNRIIATSGVEKVVKIWSHLPLNGNDVIQKSKAPPSRERFSDEQLHTIAQDDEPLQPVDSVEEDLTVLALFDTLVNEDRQLQSFSTDSTSSSDDDDSIFSQFNNPDYHVSSSEMDDVDFGVMPSSSRLFWHDLPFHFLCDHDHSSGSSDSSSSSTPSVSSLDNHSLYGYSVSDNGEESEEGEGVDSDASQTDGQGQETEPHPLRVSRDVDFEPNSHNTPTCSSLSPVQSPAQPLSHDSHALLSSITTTSHSDNDGNISSVNSVTTRRQRPVASSCKGQSSSSDQSSQPEASGGVFLSSFVSTSSRRTESRRQIISSLSAPNYEQYSSEDFLKTRTATGCHTLKDSEKSLQTK